VKLIDTAESNRMKAFALLPKDDLAIRGCRFAWSYRPCEALAGDFLNVIPIDEARTAFYVLDVSGHGTPAALMSAAVGRALSVTNDESSVVARVSRKGFLQGNRIDVVPPCEVTARLNRQFELDTREAKYFTIAYVVIDTDAAEMTYTLAGHPPQIFVPHGRPTGLMSCPGVPIGLLSQDEQVCLIVVQQHLAGRRDTETFRLALILVNDNADTWKLLRRPGHARLDEICPASRR
jgi:phosphoserine phosphatase RsbU/P